MVIGVEYDRGDGRHFVAIRLGPLATAYTAQSAPFDALHPFDSPLVVGKVLVTLLLGTGTRRRRSYGQGGGRRLAGRYFYSSLLHLCGELLGYRLCGVL